jgi:hypothetical protein
VAHRPHWARGALLGLAFAGSLGLPTTAGASTVPSTADLVQRYAILNGTPDTRHTFVVEIGQGNCSGTKIASHVIVTAAHCFLPPTAAPGASGAPPWSDAPVLQRAVSTSGVAAKIVQVIPHPDFRPDDWGTPDLALVVLDREPPAPSLPLNTRPFTPADAGRELTLIGYGYNVKTATGSSGNGVRREGTMNLSTVSKVNLTLQPDNVDSGATSCNGDSGGAWVVPFDGGVALGAVHRAGNCASLAVATRIDPYVSWIQGKLSELGQLGLASDEAAGAVEGAGANYGCSLASTPTSAPSAALLLLAALALCTLRRRGAPRRDG